MSLSEIYFQDELRIERALLIEIAKLLVLLRESKMLYRERDALLLPFY